MLLFALRGLLDRIPDVIDSAGRARDSWQRFRKPDLPPPADDEEPPLAAQVVRASGRPGVRVSGGTGRQHGARRHHRPRPGPRPPARRRRPWVVPGTATGRSS
ncbi:hypothetical protein ACFY8O_21920 [Streptomyces argenteolus]|uniref:Uncharacterized protein n=1 Tax=Streptomyces argenteolus TaxID=67274 RepID=A0ABW6XAJ9_9ACTN